MFGHTECHDEPTARLARNTLLLSKELLQILEYMWRPPKAGPTVARPFGAKEIFHDLSLEIICSCVDDNMDHAAQILRTENRKLSTDELKKLGFKEQDQPQPPLAQAAMEHDTEEGPDFEQEFEEENYREPNPPLPHLPPKEGEGAQVPKRIIAARRRIMRRL